MYYEKIAIVVSACALVTTVLDASRNNWHSEAHEPFHYSFSNDKTLDIDNVDGTIQVVGDAGSTIRVEGERIVRAEDQQALDRAKHDVKLDVNEKDGTAQFYVNGPFRHNQSSNSAATITASTFTSIDHEYEVT